MSIRTLTPPEIRQQLVEIALEWQRRYGVAPAVTPTLSELDAATLVGMTDDKYQLDGKRRTAVTKGLDFIHQGVRYQVKGSRPSGKPGSKVTKLGKASNYLWDRLIWILYDTDYVVQEAWMWEVEDYKREFDAQKYVRPPDMRRGYDLLQYGPK